MVLILECKINMKTIRKFNLTLSVTKNLADCNIKESWIFLKKIQIFLETWIETFVYKSTNLKMAML